MCIRLLDDVCGYTNKKWVWSVDKSIGDVENNLV